MMAPSKNALCHYPLYLSPFLRRMKISTPTIILQMKWYHSNSTSRHHSKTQRINQGMCVYGYVLQVSHLFDTVRQRHCCRAVVLVKQPTMLFQNQAHQPPRAIPTRHFSLLHPKRATSINNIITTLYPISHPYGKEQRIPSLIGNSPLHNDKY